jgi:succinate dehydrogenase / fumarate reductase cytochrome b subunit
MQTPERKTSFSDILKWFDPRNRRPGTWAFSLNRLTALGLTFYLYLHLVILGQLAQGPEAYDSFVAFAKQPVVVVGELLVVAAGLYHGLNGVRVVLTSFGIAVPYQRALFYAMAALAAIGSLYFAIRMFSA